MSDYEQLAQDVDRGIYIDFEGRAPARQGGSPTMPKFLGAYTSRKGFERFVLDPRFEPMFRSRVARRVKNIPATLDEAMETLVDRCEQDGRKLFAYSDHEQKVINKFCSDELKPRVNQYLINAKVDPIKAWRNKCHGGDHPEQKTLKAYLELIRYKYPSHLRDVAPGTVIKQAENTMKRTQRWSKVNKRLQQDWLDLLEYNWHDCKGLRRLTVKAANGLVARKSN